MTGKPNRRKFSRREFLKLAAGSLLGGSLLTIGGGLYAKQWEPEWWDFVDLPLKLPRLDRAFDGYRIIQVSDIHVGSWISPEQLIAVFEQIGQLNPDMVVVTGDFVSHLADPRVTIRDFQAAFGQVTPPDGILAVLGNHDHWVDATGVREILAACEIIDISNGLQTLKKGAAQLHIAGVDDYWEQQDRLNFVLEQLPEIGAAILLAHEPDFADISAATGRFDLQLSGHSHGGQVVIPLIGPPILPSYGEKYPSGLYRVGNMWQYTNRGLGMINPAVRFNCRPEVTIITLQNS